MENWNNSDYKIPKTSLPKDVFDSVKSKIKARRIEAQKTRRQMMVGSVLLLILGGVNIAILLSNRTKNPKTTTEKAEILQAAYFKISNNSFNE